MAGGVPRLGGRRRPSRAGAARLHPRQGTPVRRGRKRGPQAQALGVSRGGRTTKIHALSDGRGRPLAFLLTGGQAADCKAAEGLIDLLPPDLLVIADRGYDTDPVRRRIEEKGSVPNIPPKANRRWKPCFSPFLYRTRNAIERMFGRLKDFRRIATRYDKLAVNFQAALCLAAAPLRGCFRLPTSSDRCDCDTEGDVVQAGHAAPDHHGTGRRIVVAGEIASEHGDLQEVGSERALLQA